MKKLFLLLVSLVFVFSIKSIDAHADSVWECNGNRYDTWDDVLDTEPAGTGDVYEIKLLSDLQLSGPLSSSHDGCKLIIDLNGHTICGDSGYSGYLIVIDGQNCTIKNTGSLGGLTSGTGGNHGIYLGNLGRVKLSAGAKIYGTVNDKGGAVYVESGEFTLDGGTIEGCVASDCGGAVYTNNTLGDITINSGTISGCSAIKGGGVYCSVGSFYMNGGRIVGCTASEKGGGAYTCNLGMARFKGSATVINNTSSGGLSDNVYAVRKDVNMMGNLTGSVGISNVDDPEGDEAFGTVYPASSTYTGVENFFYDADPHYRGIVDPENSSRLIFTWMELPSVSDAKDPIMDAIDFAASHDLTVEINGIGNLTDRHLSYLKDHPQVTLILNYEYEGTSYRVEIAGKDAAIEPGIVYYGPLKLYEMYGPNGTIKATTDYYIIQKGDTLSKIAARFNMKIKKLLELNTYINDPNKIYAGNTLNIK